MSKSIISEPVEFWFVWTKNGRVPRFTHGYEAAAMAEAERLARKHPGQKFIVLQATHKLHVAEEPPAEVAA